MPRHRHVWSVPNAAGFRHCLEPTCGHTQRRAGGSLFDDDPPARGIPQDRLPPKNPAPVFPALKVTGPTVFDPEQFKIASAGMQSGMLGMKEAVDGLSRSMRVIQNGPLSQSIQVVHGGIIGGPPPLPFDNPGFGNHEIEASPSEALDIIVRYLRYVAEERPDDLRQVASKWMTRMTEAVTGVLKEAEEGETE